MNTWELLANYTLPTAGCSGIFKYICQCIPFDRGVTFSIGLLCNYCLAIDDYNTVLTMGAANRRVTYIGLAKEWERQYYLLLP
jgi:hypothetical protein